jgi:hypothetical protein
VHICDGMRNFQAESNISTTGLSAKPPYYMLQDMNFSHQGLRKHKVDGCNDSC